MNREKLRLSRTTAKNIIRLQQMLEFRMKYAERTDLSSVKRQNILHDAHSLRWALRELECVFDFTLAKELRERFAITHVETNNNQVSDR